MARFDFHVKSNLTFIKNLLFISLGSMAAPSVSKKATPNGKLYKKFTIYLLEICITMYYNVFRKGGKYYEQTNNNKIKRIRPKKDPRSKTILLRMLGNNSRRNHHNRNNILEHRIITRMEM